MHSVQMFTGIMANDNLYAYRLAAHAGNRINNSDTHTFHSHG